MAGKIGRSCIGQLFGSGGYQVVFADNDHSDITFFGSREKKFQTTCLELLGPFLTFTF